MKTKKYISLALAVLAMLSLSIPSKAATTNSPEPFTQESLISGFYKDSSSYRVLNKSKVDVSDWFNASTSTYFLSNDLISISQFIRRNNLIIEKHWSTDAQVLSPRSSYITKKVYVTRSEFCKNTAYNGAPGGELVYTVSMILTYNPNTFKISSYSVPVMQIKSHNWGDAFTNFQARDTAISAKLNSNGIDVTANYFFKITSDFRDTLDTTHDYYNLDFGSHGMTFSFNGDLDEQISYPDLY